jgi:hypothetical protein
MTRNPRLAPRISTATTTVRMMYAGPPAATAPLSKIMPHRRMVMAVIRNALSSLL